MSNLCEKLLVLGRNKKYEELEELAASTDIDTLKETLVENIEQTHGTALWSNILMAFSNVDKNDKKRFEIVMAVLKKMNEIELRMNQIIWIITRLNAELPKFPAKQLIVFTEYCIQSMRLGDPKCVGWKDLLPAVLNLICGIPEVSANGIQMPGNQFRSEYIRSMLTMKWPTTIVTPMTGMFKEINLSKDELTMVLEKICHELHHLKPTELPPLANQLFSLCSTSAHVMKPILSFQKYFHELYYKKLWSDLSSVSTVSSLDSIDHFSPDEIRNAEDTVILYLGNATEHRIGEKEFALFSKCLAATPKYILNPFAIAGLLSMTNVNRYPEITKLSSSHILPFLRSVVRNNEIETDMTSNSKWCRDTLDRSNIDLELVFNVLIEHSQKGNDVVTKGLVDFAFVLLKTPKNPHLHGLAIHFLVKFIRTRYIFGKGILKKLVEFLFADQDATQYVECLTLLSTASSISMTECPDVVQNILNFFLEIPGHYAMRMLCFFTPLIKNSIYIRDMLIEVLKKAMYRRDSATRKFGIHGLCIILRQLHNNNARRAAQNGNNSTQQWSLSGYSLMSQNTFGNVNNPQRNFDMMTLEIIGLLRKAFQQNSEIKEVLYEGLSKAINVNPKLAPHIIEFLSWNFRSFFEINNLEFEIKFDQIVRERIGDLEILDQLGKLTHLMTDCVIVCDRNQLEYNTQLLEDVFMSLMQRIDVISVDSLVGNSDSRSNVICCQFLNILEALINYAIWTTSRDNNNFIYIAKIFDQHLKLRSAKETPARKKKSKKTDKNDETAADSTTQPPLSSMQIYEFHPENIWNLSTMHRFLQMIFSDEVHYATISQATPMKTDLNFVKYVLKQITIKLEILKPSSNLEVKYSGTIFEQFKQIGEVIYEKCIKRLPEIYETYDAETALACTECFHQCLLVANDVYKKRIPDFLRRLSCEALTDPKQSFKIATFLQSLITKLMNIEDNTISDCILTLLQCLEILYKLIPGQDPEAEKCFNWLLAFCQKNDIPSQLDLIHKLLFVQETKINDGMFFESIAMQIKKIFGSINERKEQSRSKFELKSINLATVVSATMFLCQITKAEIEYVEYFITKTKSFFAKIKIAGKNSSESCIQAMKITEIKICTKLTHIGHMLQHLSNTRLPLGQCMDLLEKLLIQYYICMTNFTKHLTLRHVIVPFSARETKFELLLQTVGRSLPSRIYDLITYVEEEIFRQDEEEEEQQQKNRKKKLNTKADKAKVLRETKLLPKLVMRIENFNKFVIFLSNKTKSELSNYLHIGTVRDFRILSKPLRDCLDQTLQNANESEVTESLLDNSDDDESRSSASNTVDDQQSVVSLRSTTSNIIRDAPPPDAAEKSHIHVAIGNMAIINKKAKRKSANTEESSENAQVHQVKKKKRKLGMSINKRRLEEKSTNDQTDDE